MKSRERVVVIGGSSGMGLEVARKLIANSTDVVIAGRSLERLQVARAMLGEAHVEIMSMDIGDQKQVEASFAQIGAFDHLVVTAADLPYGPILELAESEIMRAVRSKFLGPVFVAQQAAKQINPGGSMTFTSGIAAKRPMKNGAIAAAINSGLEGLVRALAIELAPLRVNAVSPGWTDTPIWNKMASITPEMKQEAFANMNARLLTGRIGTTEDMADAILFLMKNTFSTGSVLDVDGGHRLV